MRSLLIPAPRALAGLGAWVGAGLAASFAPAALGPAWLAAGGALAVVLAADALWVRRVAAPTVERQVAEAVPLGVPTKVRLKIGNRGRRRLGLEVFDHYPPASELEGLPRQTAVPAGGWAEIEYQIRPLERGDATFGATEVRLASPLGLWRRRCFSGATRVVRVLPNFRPLLRYAHLAVEDRLAQMGIRYRERRGEGREFRELRDFRQGDSLRQIDWKATSRRGKPIARDFHDETDQRVVFMVDCSRRMRAREGDLAHFDHALNAVLLLAYAAVRFGDAVGLATFSGEPRWVPPGKGPAAISRLLAAVYDLESSAEPADYMTAAVRLAALERRRALVVVVSNLRDEDASEVLPALKLLRQRHLVLFASLRESALAAAAAGPTGTLDEALFVAALRQYLAARERAHEQVRSAGVLTLDVEPEKLPVAMVNRYLEIKRAGLL